jgi:hypothetical protein
MIAATIAVATCGGSEGGSPNNEKKSPMNRLTNVGAMNAT